MLLISENVFAFYKKWIYKCLYILARVLVGIVADKLVLCKKIHRFIKKLRSFIRVMDLRMFIVLARVLVDKVVHKLVLCRKLHCFIKELEFLLCYKTY